MDLIFGRWRSQTLHAGVKLGVFEVTGSAPKSSDDVASEIGTDPALTYRLMRALACIGLLVEDDRRRFSVTEAGATLGSTHPQSLRAVTLLEEGQEHYALWTHLCDMVKEGRQNAFVREFGHMAFDHTAADPAGYGVTFNEAMTSYSNVQTALVLEAMGVRGMPDTAHLCDIAGGHGHLLCHLVASKPGLTGTVIDLPNVVGDGTGLWADRLNLGGRVNYVGGDMFKGVPSADLYFMKLILHDWDDDECVQILQNARRAAKPGARLFIVEHLVTGPDTPHFAKLFDIHMMCWGTGRERTPEEYAGLLARAGWTYQETWYPATRLMGLVEGSKD
ncbi:MAG: methyltransferase [Pseudomonadota bacterium]|nr:methyltransferase [Pseudomonadota bacterium]